MFGPNFIVTPLMFGGGFINPMLTLLIYRSIDLSLSLSKYIFICIYIYIYRYRYRYSVRLPRFLNLTTSKTKLVCGTPSIFQLDSIKHEAILKNVKLSAELTPSCQCFLRFFHPISHRYWRRHEKVMPSHGKCCACHAKSSSQTWRSDAPKCNPSQEISTLAS